VGFVGCGYKLIASLLGRQSPFKRRLASVPGPDVAGPASVGPHICQTNKRIDRAIHHAIAAKSEAEFDGLLPLFALHHASPSVLTRLTTSDFQAAGSMHRATNFMWL
jgi:hypothetical protein